jgi:S1-C subfamily serine protease
MEIRRSTQRRILVLAVAGLVTLAVGARVVSASGKAQPIGKGVVVIDTNLAYESASAAGTGIVLTSSGTVLTNNHVIDGATTIKVVIPGTGRSYSAKVVGYDKTADMAVLEVRNASNLKTLKLGNSSSLTVGSLVTAYGNAGGTGSFTAATGRVTGLGKTITASDDEGSSEQLSGLIETNAGVVAGDSGGPLLDSAGRVVGMDTAASSGAGYQSISSTDAYAIPIAHALTIVQEIEAGDASATVHIGGTAFLGVEVESAGSDGYGYGGYGSTPASGALVAGVVSGGPAASAGLSAGDVITAVDGRTITSPATVSSLIVTMKPGAKITVTYADQDGGRHVVRVTLGSGPPQ